MEEYGQQIPGGDQVCLNSFKTHWAEAQIDGPMNMVSRYDDVSKLLITIGGFVLGALATMLRENHMTRGPIIAVLSLIFLFFLFAVLVCYYQPAMRAKAILGKQDDADLADCIEAWCDDLEGVIKKKRVLLYLSLVFFAMSFLMIMGLQLFS